MRSLRVLAWSNSVIRKTMLNREIANFLLNSFFGTYNLIILLNDFKICDILCTLSIIIINTVTKLLLKTSLTCNLTKLNCKTVTIPSPYIYLGQGTHDHETEGKYDQTLPWIFQSSHPWKEKKSIKCSLEYIISGFYIFSVFFFISLLRKRQIKSSSFIHNLYPRRYLFKNSKNSKLSDNPECLLVA